MVSRMIKGADAVWVSTPALAETVTELRDDVRVMPNGLDERLWTALPPPTPPRQGPVRPWKLNQNYLVDVAALRFGKVDDGVLRFAA